MDVSRNALASGLGAYRPKGHTATLRNPRLTPYQPAASAVRLTKLSGDKALAPE